MPSKKQYMKGYRTEYLSSDEVTRKLRTASKTNEDVWNKADKIDLTQCLDLIGKEFIYPVPGENRSVDKKLHIVNLYPKTVMAVYSAGLNGEKDIRVCLSIGDLIENGIITLTHGYVEVVA